MAETLSELRALSEEELILKHDLLAGTTQAGTNHYLQELSRRDQDHQTLAILGYTKWVAILTAVILAATVVNVLVSVAIMLR